MTLATDNAARDVNAAFAESKRDQIAGVLRNANSARERAEALRAKVTADVQSGAMTALGGNRFRVNTGWDRGEVITLRTDLPTIDVEQIQEAIRGDHGLDVKTDGSVALYLKDTPAWHSFGTVIPGGSSSAKTVLSAAGLDYEVLQAPSTFQIPCGWDGQGNPAQFVTKRLADSFVNYRSDTLEPLGTVGKVYRPVQNEDAFNFLDALFGEHLMVAETAGSFREGRRVFISAELPGGLYIDPDGVNDQVRMFVMLINSHDGTTPFIALVTPWRPVCKNTERFALRDAVHKWSVRHTKNAATKIDEARRTLNLTNAYYAEYVAEETDLLRVSVTSDDVEALIADVWGTPEENAAKRTVTLHTNRSDKVHELFKMESERVGRNAYAAERAVTGYVDHFTELRPRGVLRGNRLGALAQGIMEESLDEPKHKAHRKLMTLVNR